MGITLGLPFVYPILSVVHPGRAEQLCAERYKKDNTSKVLREARSLSPRVFFPLEPRALLRHHGRCYADTQCGRYGRYGIPREV